MSLQNLEGRERLNRVFSVPPAHPSPVFRGRTHDSQLPRDRPRRFAERAEGSRSHRGPIPRGHVHVASPAHARGPPTATGQHVRDLGGLRRAGTRARSCCCGLWGVKVFGVCPSVCWKDSAMNLFNTAGRMALQKLTQPLTGQVSGFLDSAGIFWKVRPISGGFLGLFSFLSICVFTVWYLRKAL